MIDQATIERILDRAQVEDVVSEFVTLRRRGVNMIGLCPFHNEKTPSFTVSPAKGLWKCFGCGKGGNAVHFIMEHEQLNYYEALKWLAHKYGIEIRERELNEDEKKAQNLRESLFLINEFARDFFVNALHNTKEGQTVGLNYFNHRGFREDIIRKFQLGYCPERDNGFTQEALKKGYDRELLGKTGLSILYDDGRLKDRFWGRVMFPVHTLSGKVVAFGGRVMKTDSKTAKYVNSPESDIYHKSNQLYGIYFAKQEIVKKDTCFLVEGYTDVISMHQAGVGNVVASSGTSLTPGQIRLIHRFTNNITVLYDGDYAGIKASLRGIDMLLAEGMNIKVVLLPDGEDPDSYARSHNADAFQNYIKDHEVDFIRFKTELLLKDAGNDPIRRAGLVESMVRSISVIPNDIVRAEYIKECSEQLDVEERLLVSEINKEKARTDSEGYRPYDNPAPDTEKKETDNESEQNAAADPSGQEPKNVNVEKYRTQEEKMLLSKERLIIQNLIKYGEKEICELKGEAKKTLRVIEFVANDFGEEEIDFALPLHQLVLEEGTAHIDDKGFIAEKFYLTHPNPEISRLAAELSNERYQLSRIHAKNAKELSESTSSLYNLFTHIIIDYKLTLVDNELKLTMKELQKPEAIKDEKHYKEIMKRYMELKELQQLIAKRLGERVLNA